MANNMEIAPKRMTMEEMNEELEKLNERLDALESTLTNIFNKLLALEALGEEIFKQIAENQKKEP